jgi:hypothetical protein
MANETKYAVLRFHQPLNGRSYYQARECGSVTCKRSSMWVTRDREAAQRMAEEVGGTVVSL